MCFDRNINGNRDVKFLIAIIGHCTDQRKLLYVSKHFRMSHWCQQMVDGAEHLISCDWLAFLSAFSHLQLIQNSAPSTICWCQCDIRIVIPWIYQILLKYQFCNKEFQNICNSVQLNTSWTLLRHFFIKIRFSCNQNIGKD